MNEKEYVKLSSEAFLDFALYNFSFGDFGEEGPNSGWIEFEISYKGKTSIIFGYFDDKKGWIFKRKEKSIRHKTKIV